MSYACTAVAGKGRCPNHSYPDDKDCFCHEHAAMRDAGHPVQKVGKPNTVLLRVSINDGWKRRMLKAGVVEVAEKERDTETGKDDRQTCTGVPVFGKDGVQEVSFFECLRELARIYEVTDVHIKPCRDKNSRMSILVISFTETAETNFIPETPEEILSLLASSCWGYAHVWANPQQEDGRVIHTVNIGYRKPDAYPAFVLCFNQGLWSVEVVR